MRDAVWRACVYWAVNGAHRMTPRQRRRFKHKHHHSMAPFNMVDLHRHT